ncbi:MAG: hypothetical protein FVQ79_11015 [Planctomycetes bacterium]|nr:hypothetical protein [Planctomycetota bacterium]
MSRKLFILGFFVSVVLISGCVEKVAKDDPRFRADAELSNAAIIQGFGVPEAGEIDIVEEMASYRAAYKSGLEKLVEYYMASGDAVKLGWAKRELASLNAGAQYRYIMPAAAVDANLRALDTIDAADTLFAEAERINRSSGAILKDEGKLRAALRKYNLLIATYPSSDKIDNCAYRAGRIYAHFRDYEIAAIYYQRAFQWDADTPYPARFKAAYILDRRLQMRKEALVLYQLAYNNPTEQKYEGNMEFSKKRILELTKSGVKLDRDKPVLPGTEKN